MATPSQRPPKSGLSGEYGNIALLLLLYTLQGVPMGLGKVIPMILKERGCSYAELGQFSLQSWPFSLKLLWAPLADTHFIARIGRRKTWLVPAQTLIGIIMMYASTRLDELLYAERPQVASLTLLFLAMNFMCATQDIAVDGWALTMLRPENAAFQATCNAAGQTFGFALGWTGVTVLEQLGLATLSSFMLGAGMFFIIVTIAVALLKAEAPVRAEDQPEGLVAAYSSIYRLLQLPPMRTLMIVLFSWKLGFAVVDSVAGLKFQEAGVPKEHMTYMGSLLMPLEIVLPLLAARWTSGANPFDLALACYPFKVLTVPLTAALVFLTPRYLAFYPWGYWAAMLAVALLGSITTEWMFVSQISLFAKVADPTIGATYMSFLNTMANLGQKLPPTATFFLVDRLTGPYGGYEADGYYVMTAVCTALGVAWYVVAAAPVRRMQRRSPTDWHVGEQKKQM